MYTFKKYRLLENLINPKQNLDKMEWRLINKKFAETEEVQVIARLFNIWIHVFNVEF